SLGRRSRRLHDRPTLAPRLTRSSTSGSSASSIPDGSNERFIRSLDLAGELRPCPGLTPPVEGRPTGHQREKPVREHPTGKEANIQTRDSASHCLLNLIRWRTLCQLAPIAFRHSSHRLISAGTAVLLSRMPLLSIFPRLCVLPVSSRAKIDAAGIVG